MAHPPYPLGLPAALEKNPPLMHCDGCAIGHYKKSPHLRISKQPPPGHTIVTDIARPMTKMAAGHQYFMTDIELHTRMNIVYLLKTKSETKSILQSSATRMERHFGHPIARIRCNNANEYLSKLLLCFFQVRAASVESTTANTPEENGIAKISNRTLMQ